MAKVPEDIHRHQGFSGFAMLCSSGMRSRRAAEVDVPPTARDLPSTPLSPRPAAALPAPAPVSPRLLYTRGLAAQRS
jgi:hypothetical protein